MRVLIVSAWDPRSGVLTIYRALAKYLRPHGVRFSAFAFDGWGEDTLWTFCDELIDGREVTLADALASGHYDLLQCVDTTYSPPWGVETWVRRARFRGPVVLLGSVAERVLTGPTHATRYVAVSEEAARVLSQDASGPVVAVPSGYDDEVFNPGPAPPQDRSLLAWVGRSYDPVKDVELFLDLLETLPEQEAVLVDSAPELQPGIAARIAEIGDRLHVAHMLAPDEMAGVYRQAALSGGALVNTSRSEGFNCAIVEALGCGCPVVAPRLPGLAHLVDGLNALLYDREDGARGPADALRRLADPTLRSRLVDEGRRQAEQLWTASAMADSYLELYREAVDAAGTLSLATRLIDPLARAGWRLALRVRPYWQRLRG